MTCCGNYSTSKMYDFNKDCCSGGEVVQDKICCKFSLYPPDAQDVYVNNTGQCVAGSGTISLGCSNNLNIIGKVRFYNGNTPVGQPIYVFEESCVAFTAARFTRIEVQAKTYRPGYNYSNNLGDLDFEEFDDLDDLEEVGVQAGTATAPSMITGNICFSPRYQLHV